MAVARLNELVAAGIVKGCRVEGEREGEGGVTGQTRKKRMRRLRLSAGLRNLVVYSRICGTG